MPASDFHGRDAGWWDHAACLGEPLNLFFPHTGQTANKAKQICGQCPVQSQCLDWANETRTEYGVFGNQLFKP